MRSWSVPPLLALLFCALAGLASLDAAEDPGELFLQVFQTYRGGERLEANGKAAEALQKYRFCVSVLMQIQNNNPKYQPIVIDFRLRKSRESIARVESLLASNPAGPAAPASTSPAPAPRPAVSAPPASGGKFPQFSTAYRLPVAGNFTPPAAPAFSPASPDDVLGSTDAVIERGVVNALKERIRALQNRVGRQNQAIDDLNRQLLDSTAREQMAQTEVDRTRVQNVELRGQLEEATRSQGDLQQANDSLVRERGAAERRIAGLESDLEAARADLEVAGEYNDELFAKLEKAAQFIDSSEKIRTQLFAERKELGKRAHGNAAELERLEKERDAALGKNESLRKQVDAAEGLAATNRDLAAKLAGAEQKILDVAKNRAAADKAEEAFRQEVARLKRERDTAVASVAALRTQTGDAAKLAAQNREMAGRLQTAEQQIAVLAKNRDERQKIEDGLRSEIASVNQALVTLRGQLSAGATQIADLEKQLSDTASATAITTGAMAEENALLKSLVARQLGEQARRQQARKLVEEEMQKLQIRSTALVEKLEALGGAETELTPRERKLFEKPVGGIAASGADFSLSIAKNEPASDLPEDLAARAKNANRLAQEGRLAESRTLYEEIARQAPQSYFAAVNLGITERRLGNYPQAIAAFRHALDLKPGDAFTLTNLGGAEYRSGAVAAAIATLQKSVAADAGDYMAHYLLALALNQSGDTAAARREVGRALDLKPDYLPAVQLAGELGKESSAAQPPVGGSEPAR